MSSVPFSIRIDSEIKKQLESEAKALDRSASYLVVEAIKRYLEVNNKQKLAIEAALKEAEKGEFISHQSMRNWFASLGSENTLPYPKANISRRFSKSIKSV